MVNGNDSLFTEYNGYATITPHQVMPWRIEGSWFDFSTDTRFEPIFQMQSKPGRLAFILDTELAVRALDSSASLGGKLTAHPRE